MAFRRLLTIAVAAALCLTLPAFAAPNRVTFPENIDELVHYATVNRGEVTEHMVTTPEAIAAAKAGQPMPDGTHVVLIDYRGGEVFRYFVMQKGTGWGEDQPEDRRTGDWQFQAFTPDRTNNLNEDPARCQGCHRPRESTEFQFMLDDLLAFGG